MVSQVTLGSFFTTSTGQQVLGGSGGSGLDTQSIINGLVTAKSLPITNDKTQLTTNGGISSALTQFQSLLSSFQSAADALRNPPGVGNAANDVFQFTTAAVTASDGSTASNFLNVITSAGASTQNYTINSIQQLATAASQHTGELDVANADAAFVGTTPASGGSIAAGTLTPQSKLGISGFQTGGQGSGNIIVSVNSVANLKVGQSVTVAGASGTLDGIDPSNINGSQIITAIDTTNNTFTFASAGAASAGGVSSSEGAAATATNSALPGITLAAGDSLNDIAAKFNSVSTQTGITATVIQLSSGKFELSFTAANTGSDGSFDLKSTAVDSGHSVFSGASLSTAVLGGNAEFTVNGISTPIERQSNSINNVINGVTFNLTGTFNTSNDPTKSLNVGITPDTTTIQNAIVSFVTSYNAIQTFAAQQTQLASDGTYAATAILANNQTFRTAMNNLNIDVTSQVAGVSGLNSLASLGITLTNQPAVGTGPQVQNILTVDDGQLASDLASNFNAVNAVFGFNLTSSNSNVKVFSATNSLGVSNFTLNLQPSTSNFTATYNNGDGPVTVNLTATALPGVGFSLAGPAGSAIAGLTLIYGSNSDATGVDINATQGIASLAYNDSNNATAANTGTLAVAQAGIQTNNTTLNTDITNVTQQVNQYQTQLLQQYSALEQAVSQVNTLLASLNANSVAQQEAANI